MSNSKDMLECMATILRDNGYEVALKEYDTKESDIKVPYNRHRFNKIRDLHLGDIDYDTCLFLSENVVRDFKLHDYVACSSGVTIGYIERLYEDDYEDNDCVEDIVIKTNRTNPAGCTIVENLSDYHYVIKLSDVFKLMASNEDFNA